MPAPAPAATPKAKSEDGISLDRLFDDLNDGPLKENVRKDLPLLEKPGSWDSKVIGGIHLAETIRDRQQRSCGHPEQ